MTEFRPYYSDDEMITRIWDRELIQNLMSKRAYYIANDWRRKELNDLWVRKDAYRRSASLGKNWGFYVGMDDISYGYVVCHNRTRHEQLDAYCSAHPEVENHQKNLGVGTCSFHPFVTPLIEIARDGVTAKGIWESYGQETVIDGSGFPKAFWLCEKVGVDFVKEDGEWRIWHLSEATDLVCEDGTDYSKNPDFFPPDGEHPFAREYGKPTIAITTHNPKFNWLDNYPPEPEKYFTFMETFSYGPEGHPDYSGKEAKR